MSSVRQRKVQPAEHRADQHASAQHDPFPTPAYLWPGTIWSTQPLILLCTGTTVAVLGQWVNNQAAISPKAQLLVLARYVFTFVTSALLCARQFPNLGRSFTALIARDAHKKQNPLVEQQQCAADSSAGTTAHRRIVPRKVQLLLVFMGILDLASYAIYNLGFAACGSALASVTLAAAGQISTALLSVTALCRKLSTKHVAAVAIVTLGLLLRSADDIDFSSLGSTWASGAKAMGGSGSGMLSSSLYGVLCVVLSALLFSVLGCMYEVLMTADPSHSVSQAQASAVITGVSLIATCAHQLLYTLPNLNVFVLEPIAASSHSVSSIAASHVLYGLVTAVHQYVQVRLLGSHGAMAVGLVNAVRASVVSFVSSWLFCSTMQHLCITDWRAVSALVVTVGAALWVLAGKPLTRKILPKRHAQ